MRRWPACQPEAGDSNPELTEPQLFDLRLKARSLAYLFSAGAALAALTVVLPHDSEFREWQIAVVAAVALVVAVLLGSRLGRDLDIRQGRGSRIVVRPLRGGYVEVGGTSVLDETRAY